MAALHDDNTGSRLVEEALKHLRNLLHGYADRDLQGQADAGNFSQLLRQKPVTQDIPLLMRRSLTHFENGHDVAGGRVLRQIFIFMENALSDLSLSVGIDLLIMPVLDMFIRGRQELLKTFMSHIASLAAVRGGVSSNPAGRSAAALDALARHEPERLTSYANAAVEVLRHTIMEYCAQRLGSGQTLERLGIAGHFAPDPLRLPEDPFVLQWSLQVPDAMADKASRKSMMHEAEQRLAVLQGLAAEPARRSIHLGSLDTLAGADDRLGISQHERPYACMFGDLDCHEATRRRDSYPEFGRMRNTVCVTWATGSQQDF
jgi:hypothetical protein